MKKSFLLSLTLLLVVCQLASAQTEIPLRYGQGLPKNLYSAPTAVLISYTTNRETTPADDLSKINELSTQLLTDNQQLGLQMLHFSDKNALLQPAAKQRLLKQYDSLKIENLLFLEINDLSGMGAQGSYVLKLTAYNKTPKLMSPKQKAYLQQAETYPALIRDLKGTLSDYPPNYFLKGPERTPQKPTLAAEPTPEPAPVIATETAKPVKPLTYPPVKLTAEDEDRYFGGPTSNFHYYLGASQQEKNAGFFGQHLRKDIISSPEAIAYLNKYRNYKIAYLAERAVFVTSLSLYANEVLSDDEYVYFNDQQKVYLGVAAGSLLVNVLLSRKTNEHMRRAIGEYNAFATMQNQSGFYKFRPDNFGFGAVYDKKMLPGLNLSWNLR